MVSVLLNKFIPCMCAGGQLPSINGCHLWTISPSQLDCRRPGRGCGQWEAMFVSIETGAGSLCVQCKSFSTTGEEQCSQFVLLELYACTSPEMEDTPAALRTH